MSTQRKMNTGGLFNSKNALNFKQQNFDKIKKDCILNKQVFQDLTFPATTVSLYSVEMPDNKMEWVRPPLVMSNVSLMQSPDPNHFLKMGSLAVSWFSSAFTAVCVWPENLAKLFPNAVNQETDFVNGEFHFGAVLVHLYFHEEVVKVTVDTQLPKKGGEFLYTSCNSEFFPCYLEKALAKVYGSYKALEGVSMDEGLINLTGGVVESFGLRCETYDDTNFMFDKLLYEFDQKNLLLVVCKNKTAGGLVAKRAYVVSGIKIIITEEFKASTLFNDKRERRKMLRLRNPEGAGVGMWKGAWSDDSPEMGALSPSMKEKLGLTYTTDAEFWISFKDVCSNFDSVKLCRVHNLTKLNMRDTWYENIVDTRWNEWLSGGCVEHGGRVLANPQIMFDISEDNVRVDISLYQHADDDEELIRMGFLLLHVEANRGYRLHRLEFAVVKHNMKTVKVRRLLLCDSLNRGRYVLVPCTQIANQEAGFTLRMYTRVQTMTKELTLEKPAPPICFLFFSYPDVAIRLLIIKAKYQDRNAGNPNPFCIIRCDSDKVRTSSASGTREPEWNEAFIFYRASPKTPITIDMYGERVVKDFFMGCTSVPADCKDGEILELQLFSHHKAGKIHVPGKLFVQIFMTTDLCYI